MKPVTPEQAYLVARSCASTRARMMGRDPDHWNLADYNLAVKIERQMLGLSPLSNPDFKGGRK